MLNSILQTSSGASATPADFLLCLAVSLAIGLFLAFVASRSRSSSRSFLTTLVVLPAAVCAVILMVNGSIGTGVAVAGAFSLVRFRSAPGTAREIGAIFLAMSAGLMAGMGYLGYAVLFSGILGIAVLAAGRALQAPGEQILRLAVPEDLDYSHVFDDLFAQYTVRAIREAVKTANMGALYKLTYRVRLRDADSEKAFLDALRVRNGNLEVSLAEPQEGRDEL